MRRAQRKESGGREQGRNVPASRGLFPNTRGIEGSKLLLKIGFILSTLRLALVFLIGDWNLNLINHHCHKATSDFLDLLYSRMYFPLITRPTRITANKASLIDSIFTNDPHRPSVSGTSDKDKYVFFREKMRII